MVLRRLLIGFFLVASVGGAAAAPGDLDSTFGNGGRVSTPFPNQSFAQAIDTAQQPDGKLLVAGYFQRFGACNRATLVRYNRDGSLDATFADGGRFLASGCHVFASVALRADGKIVLAGYPSDPPEMEWSHLTAWRLHPDGRLDDTFGAGGVFDVSLNPMANEFRSKAVALQPDGKIVVAGMGYQEPNSRGRTFMAVARLLPDGGLDSAFSGDGVVTIAPSLSNSSASDAIVLQPDGKIVVSGRHDIFGALVVRLNPDGSLDSGFGSAGMVTNANLSYAKETIIQPGGKLVLGGGSAGSNFVLARYNANGTPDASFGTDGVTVTNLGADGVTAGLARQPDGRLILGGSLSNGSIRESVIFRYDANGNLDASFANSGHARAAFPSGNFFVMSMLRQADGRVVLAGINDNAWALARLDTSYATTTTIAASANPVASGQAVTFTASVLGGETFTGTFQFNEGSRPIPGCAAVPVAGYRAQCTMTTANEGRRMITAEYSGDSGFHGSSSPRLLLAVGPTSANRWTMTDLGRPPDQGVINVGGINDAGHVAGSTYRSTTQFQPCSYFVHDGQGFRFLGSAGATCAGANAISNTSEIVGKNERAFQVNYVTQARPSLPPLSPDEITGAFGVNDSGAAVGYSFSSVNSGNGRRAVLWRDGVATYLGHLGVPWWSWAYAINNAGQVVGHADVVAGLSTVSRAFLYTNGVMSDLGTLGGNESRAFAINNRSEVVGMADTASGESRAFVYSNGVMRDLGTLGGANSLAAGINDRGQIVGVSQRGDGPAYFPFLYENGVMIDLVASPEFFNAGFERWRVGADAENADGARHGIAINNRGQIAGFGTKSGTSAGGVADLFILAPRSTPEADDDGDGVPNGIEPGEGLNPQVKDNDIFTHARLFAMQQYRDFLGREGDAAGVNNWTAQINGGAMTRAQVIEGFFDSTEFQNGLPQCTRLYFSFFNRIPDYAGLMGHVGRYRAGVALGVIAQDFSNSPEFTNAYGSLDNGQYVDRVYQNVLGRPADPEGRANWVAQLDGGAMTRGEVMVGFSESQEFKQVIATEVFVNAIYVGMLRRAPDRGGFDNWVAYFESGASRTAMLDGFMNSQEYHNRFLP